MVSFYFKYVHQLKKEIVDSYEDIVAGILIRPAAEFIEAYPDFKKYTKKVWEESYHDSRSDAINTDRPGYNIIAKNLITLIKMRALDFDTDDSLEKVIKNFHL